MKESYKEAGIPAWPSKTVSVIIPVYNNIATLQSIFDEVDWLRLTLYERWGMALEVVYVDDGSSDGSRRFISQNVGQRKNERLIINRKNIGAIMATYKGIKASTGDCILSMAADLQDPFSVVVSLVETWTSGAKFCAAKRRSRQDPMQTKLQSYLFYLVLRIFVFRDFPLGGFDICLIDKKLKKLVLSGPNNIAFGISAYWHGYRPAYVYYDRQRRAIGFSSWKLSKRISYAVDILLVCSNVIGRSFFVAGLTISVVSAGMGIYVVLVALVQGYPVQGWASLMILVSILSSIFMLYLSFIAAYLTRIYGQLILSRDDDCVQ